jgi:toxin secretion/phage lysis holin
MEIWNWVQVGCAALGGFIGWAVGGLDGFVYTLVAFSVIDYLTGLMCAIVERNLSSEIGFRGIFKKVTIFAMVAVGHMVDTHIIGTAGVVGDYSAVRTAVIFFYAANEGLSLLENASRLGLPVPRKLKDILAQIHKRENKNNEEDESK